MTRPGKAKHCVKCSRRGKVTDSRPVLRLGAQRRHHVCKCGHEWNTYEVSLDIDILAEALEVVASGRRTTSTVNTPGRHAVSRP